MAGGRGTCDGRLVLRSRIAYYLEKTKACWNGMRLSPGTVGYAEFNR